MAILISDINLKQDWIEFENTSSTARDISGWTVTDITKTNLKRHKFIFPDATKIYGKATLRLWSKDGNDDPENIYWNRGAAVWNNPGDKATLYTKDGKFVDEQTLGYGVVEGYVKVSQPTRAVAGAEVSADSGEMAYTDRSGFYSLRLQGLSPRGVDRKITAKAKGYESQTLPAGVWVNQTTETNFVLGEEDLESKKKEGKEAIDLSIESVDMPKTAYIKEPYYITIVFKNNGTTIDYFESDLYEDKNYRKPKAEYDTGKDTATNNSFSATYEIMHEWAWYVINAETLGYVDLGETEKTFSYEISYFGETNEVSGDWIGPVPIGSVKVVVPKRKLAAAERFNRTHDAVLLDVVTLAFFVLTGNIFGIAAMGLVLVGLYAIRDGEERKIQDPPEYDKRFRKLYYAKTKFSNSASFKDLVFGLSDLAEAHRITQNRIYTAKLKSAEHYETLQRRNLAKIESLLNKHKIKLRKFKKTKFKVLSPKEFKQVQTEIKKHGLPNKLVKLLKQNHIPVQTIRLFRKILPKLPNKRKYRDLNKTMPKVIADFEKSLSEF